MGELSNINLFGRLLDNSEMEDITLCQDYLAGDLVKKCQLNLHMVCQISWSAETYTLEGNVTQTSDVVSNKFKKSPIESRNVCSNIMLHR